MRRPVAAAACCLAISASPLLAGCAPTASIDTQQPEANPEAAQDVDAKPTQEAPKVDYQDGTYTGEGQGMGGPIAVTLTVADGVIAVDEITEAGETPGVGGKEAIEDGTFKQQIEEAQSAEIDGVTGATMTSGGVREAVEKALAQAK
ncbi:FMN-binding protein [uncultured Adlercreutzia sp.]|uniref:FMN-binding protein n=1 Tax=uncultured Adlercreutzia sp. TaxID=875803 RepID=UPI00267492B5|nr:FMN-binding protein [uncultured Adlercreutzia sp.]